MSEKGDEEDESATSASWWGSFYDTAKRKLAETNEFMMRDMKEFTETVKTDTSKLVAATATSMKDQLNIKVDMNEASQATKVVTNTLTGFLGTVVNHVTPQPPSDNENEDSTVLVGTTSGVKIFSPAEARLFAIQTDPGTYCNEPDNSTDFKLWEERFNLEGKREEISLLMLDCKEIRALYTRLVPDAVTHHNFWTRYFFKINAFKKAEARRAEIVQRAEEKDTELTWDDEDEFEAESPQTPEGKVEEKIPEKLSDVAEHSPVTTDTIITPPQDGATETALSPRSDTQTHDVDKQPKILLDVGPENIEDPTLVDEKTNLDTASNNSKQTKVVTEEEPPRPTIDVTANDVTPASDVKSASSEVTVKESSSGGSSDWEKEFDLEMTEDEIKEALLEDVENIDEEEVEGWEEWE